MLQPSLAPERVHEMRRLGYWPDFVLTDFLDQWASQAPDRVAVVDHNSVTGQRTALTFRALADRVDRLARGLLQLGIRRGEVISFQLPNWWQFHALHLAALRIGAVTNPLMPIFRERELRFMLGLAESRLLVVPRHFRGFDHAAMAERLRPNLPALRHVRVVGGEGDDAFEHLFVDAAPATPDGFIRPDPNEVIQLLYTSGTTGEPKGAMHISNTLFSNIIPYAERLGLSGRDVVLMASPMAHQTGFMYGLMMALYLGARNVLQDIWVPEQAADIIEAEGATFTMASTPFLNDLTAVAQRRPAAFRSFRVFLAGGAPIPRVLARRATEALGASIVPGWGMTENGAICIGKLDDPPEKIFDTDGCPLPGIEIRVVDPNGAALPAGEEGRLQARGCSNFVGYLKRPELNGTDAQGWFDTGDLARIDAEGYVRITGRSKDIIIRGGENIPVVEIEQLLYRHPAVQELAIVAMPDPRLGERCCAFVVPKPDASLDFGDMIRFLEDQHVARSYMPERLEVIAEMPKTPSGKIQKFRLREAARTLAATPTGTA
ncbi:MAG: cyclohexanecarboxylate-CoA ligase [Rhodospirillales bacterium 20-64-7]|nr:MAG: cyclohexanecarboxylate-CoA ligase [Rhodospirillales bacterium 20-64-7]HQT78380.1 cyclohexanecarboxylate-CoA ligase [Rhodopila sp.]